MDRVVITYVKTEFEISDLNAAEWTQARPVNIHTYWSGEAAPSTRHFSARLLWSDSALYVRFDAQQHEPLVMSEKPDLRQKTLGLWDRDVCEIFIAPDKATPHKYFEFEIAPTGEWVDLAIEFTPEGRNTDWDHSSGIKAAASVTKDKVVQIIKIPFESLGGSPRNGDRWLGNLFRCVGMDPTRGYLAWRPTRTKEPAFHVPSAFGEFEFSE